MDNRRISPASAALVFGLGTLVSHGFGLSLVPAMLPRIEEDFQSGYGALGVAVATGLVAYALGSVLASPIMRLVPTRGLLVGTFALTGVGFLMTAFASSPITIAVAVVILGISAPVSWTATMHVARERVSSDSLSIVSAGASGGASVGVILNGVLVQTSGSIHTWRASFFVAAIVALAVMVIALAVFRQPVPKPDSSGIALIGVFRRVLADPSGRMIVATSAISGITVFTLATFLTATAIDEMACRTPLQLCCSGSPESSAWDQHWVSAESAIGEPPLLPSQLQWLCTRPPSPSWERDGLTRSSS